MALTFPYRQHHYMGEFSSDANANTGITTLGFTRTAGMIYWNTASKILRAYDGTYWVNMSEAFPGIERVVFVDASSFSYTEDGSPRAPYKSIASAVTAANAMSPASDNQILIIVFPGRYKENVSLTSAYVHVWGVNRDACILYHTSGTELLSIGCSHVKISGFTFDAGAASIYLVKSATTSQSDVWFDDCRFIGRDTGNYLALITNTLSWRFDRCIMEHTTPSSLILSDQSAAAGGLSDLIEMHDCRVIGRVDSYRKNLKAFDSRFSSDYEHPIYVQGTASPRKIEMYACTIENTDDGNAITFTVSADFEFVGCRFYSTVPGTHYDINSSAAPSGTVSGCSMVGGMHHSVKTNNKRKRVGEDAGIDFYYSLADLVGAMAASDKVIIEVIGDVDLGTTGYLSPPASSDIVIDGLGRASITGTNTYLCLQATGNTNSKLKLQNIRITGNVGVQATGCALTLKNVHIDGGRVHVLSGTDTAVKVVIDGSVVAAASDNYALEIDDVDPTIIIIRSYLRGHSTNNRQAIKFDSANPNVKIGWSQVFGGALNANPCTNPGSAITMAYHHSSFNMDPADNANLSNSIATPYNVIDDDAIYYPIN